MRSFFNVWLAPGSSTLNNTQPSLLFIDRFGSNWRFILNELSVSTHTSPYWAHTYFSSLIDSPDLAIDDYSTVLLATVLRLGFGREILRK
jgi:hypothetical protein